ncbi:MAG: type II toxin-antitoxin system VapB family antitoxin [Myxococcota bacterium]|nr:type II toxin-antitoxin system VapB family antitoxin [Myxococcota bacterium]
MDARQAHVVSPGRSSMAVRRTCVELDTELVERAMEITGASSKREAVDTVLRRIVERGALYRALRAARGTAAWRGDLRAWRRGR